MVAPRAVPGEAIVAIELGADPLALLDLLVERGYRMAWACSLVPGPGGHDGERPDPAHPG